MKSKQEKTNQQRRTCMDNAVHKPKDIIQQLDEGINASNRSQNT
jgi:hypothetical protein